MFKSYADIDAKLKQHDDYRKDCLNLIASENYSSEKSRSYLSGDFSNRYGCYSLRPEEREYTGNKYIYEFEIETQELILDVFGGKYVDPRPISGHLAGVATVVGVMEPGETVIEISHKDWGHGLVGPMCNIKHFDETINVEYMAFDNGEVDFEKLVEQARKINPKLVIFGGSGTIFTEPFKAFRPIADELGIIVAYDASHVTGLIAGKTFPNPLKNGCDIMFGSTHKSFPGPQGGFVITNDEELLHKISKTIYPSLVTSHHLNRIPALAASLLEMKEFGKEYAEQIVKNSRALAKALADKGFDVVGSKEKGYTETHLLLVRLNDEIDSEPGKMLEKANIFVSDDFSGESFQIRVGTPEITRRGMKEEQMDYIAELIKRVLKDNEDVEKIGREVTEFIQEYNEKLYYTF